MKSHAEPIFVSLNVLLFLQFIHLNKKKILKEKEKGRYIIHEKQLDALGIKSTLRGRIVKMALGDDGFPGAVSTPFFLLLFFLFSLDFSCFISLFFPQTIDSLDANYKCEWNAFSVYYQPNRQCTFLLTSAHIAKRNLTVYFVQILYNWPVHNAQLL